MSKSITSKFQLKRAVSISVVLLSLSISLTATTQVIVLADEVNLPILTAFDTVNEIPSFFALDMPYYEQETGQSGGVAALKMALGHYGWTIDESELIRVARTSYLWWNTGTNGWDLLRAAHFSNSSTSFHDPTLQGYTNKWSGVDSAAGVITDAYSSENRTQVLDMIKGLLLDDKVTIFTMWYAGDQDFVRQFRVLVGYDDRTDELIFADPWDDPYWNTSYDNLFEYWWLNGGQPAYWIQGIFPWEIELNITPSSEIGMISVDATIDTGVPEWWRTWPDFEDWKEVSEVERCYINDTYVNLEIPEGYTIESGDPITSFEFDAFGHATVSWQIEIPTDPEVIERIHATVQGQINGRSPTYGVYTDTISVETSLSLWDSCKPELGQLSISDINWKGIQLGIEIEDQSQIGSAEVLWRSEVTNWTRSELTHIGGSQWSTNSELPRPFENLTQIQIIIEDIYNNTAESVIYECDWTGVEYILPPVTIPLDTGLILTISVAIPLVLILGAVKIKRSRRENI